MDHLPTVDQILADASCLPDRSTVNHEQLMNLFWSCSNGIKDRFGQYGVGNILTDSYFNEYAKFLKWSESIELQIFGLRSLMSSGIKLSNEQIKSVVEIKNLKSLIY